MKGGWTGGCFPIELSRDVDPVSEKPLFGVLFKPGGPPHSRAIFPLPKNKTKDLDVNDLSDAILARHGFHLLSGTPRSLVYANSHLTSPKPTVQVSPIDGDASRDPSHSPSDKITDGGKATAGEETVDQCADGPGSASQAQGTNTDTDLGVGLSNRVSDDSLQPDPMSMPSASERKPAFVKIIDLDEEDRFTSWLEAFIGKSSDI